MNIVLIAHHTQGTDGWSRYTVNLRDALGKLGHTMTLITAPSPLSFFTRPWRAFTLARTARCMFQRQHIDVLHFTVEPYALALLFLPKRIRDRTVLTIHGNYGIRPMRFWMTKPLWPIVLRRISRFITVSAYTKDAVMMELRRAGYRNLAEQFAERATVIRNGIPFQSCKPTNLINPTNQTNPKRILHIGGLKPAKGVREAIEACARYRQLTAQSFHLTFVGAIPGKTFRKEIELLIEERGLADAVSIRGIVTEEELTNLYRTADLLLVPSQTSQTSFEGFGLVYIEANAYGVPVIGPNTSGTAEAIKDCVSGYTVDVSDSDAIAERMRWILDEKRIDQKACRKWAEEHDIAFVGRQVESVYMGIIGENYQ